jgi:hypothetical protein
VKHGTPHMLSTLLHCGGDQNTYRGTVCDASGGTTARDIRCTTCTGIAAYDALHWTTGRTIAMLAVLLAHPETDLTVMCGKRDVQYMIQAVKREKESLPDVHDTLLAAINARSEEKQEQLIAIYNIRDWSTPYRQWELGRCSR